MKMSILGFILCCLGLVVMPACTGGGCTYTEYEGICTGEGAGLFTFEGTVGGEAVTLMDNVLSGSTTLPSGESQSCKLMASKTGACTPCVFDIGEATGAAWDLCRTLF